MSLSTQILLVVFSYLIGGISFGYWLVRWWLHEDIRTLGSGSTGATNVGRFVGTWGFVVVMLLDGAKGAVCVWISQGMSASELCQTWVAFAVVFGHIWPVVMKFSGGKGVATLAGAWIALQPLALVFPIAIGAAIFLLIKRVRIAGLFGLLGLPLGMWIFGGHDWRTMLVSGLMLLIVFFAHRDNLANWWDSLRKPSL